MFGLKTLINNKLAEFSLNIQEQEWQKIEKIADGLSHAEITRACEDAAKHMILEGGASLSFQNITDMLEERSKAKSNV